MSASYFFLLSDPNVQYVALGAMLLTGSSALMGTFALLSKKSLVGDAIAHAVLPGVCLGFILAGTKEPLWILAGAFLTGALSVYLIDFIVHNSHIKEDTAIGLVLSVMFGAGIVLLTAIQKTGNAAQSGLDQYLFGRAAAINRQDLLVFGTTSVLIMALVIVFFRSFTLLAFDRHFAHALGFNVKFIQFIQTTLIVLAVVIGIQAVGVVLMAAILITPAAAARYWCNSVKTMLWLSSAFGMISGLCGALISYAAPAMPTGPWIVVVASVIAFVSLLVAPEKGMLSRSLRQRRLQQTIAQENLLKTLYKLGEKNEDFLHERTAQEIMRNLKSARPQKLLRQLLKQGYVERNNNHWKLTEAGYLRAQRIVKIHRLWELYLTTYMNIAPDHVHDDAETIEHLLTPELEKELERQLGYPSTDPHQSQIPYRKT
ncbi:MAG: manganese transport system membrane protein MntC [Cyclobacteriaceae bacterium]|nr:MAG: manganese transport system membrane protein MntC [Cyclobacteriaceae bacterium]